MFKAKKKEGKLIGEELYWVVKIITFEAVNLLTSVSSGILAPLKGSKVTLKVLVTFSLVEYTASST